MEGFEGMVPFGLYGIRIYENAGFTETETYEEEITLTFRQRWIKPLLHGITMPFEPWVNTRVEKRYRTVPSRKILHTAQGLYMHPVMAAEVRRQIAESRQR